MLKLSRNTVSSAGGTLTATAVSGAWTEGDLTWNNRPGRTAGSPYVTATDDGQSATVELDLTKLVTPGQDLNLILTTTAATSTIFSSKESAKGPELTLITGEIGSPTAVATPPGASPSAASTLAAPLAATPTRQAGRRPWGRTWASIAPSTRPSRSTGRYRSRSKTWQPAGCLGSASSCRPTGPVWLTELATLGLAT